MDLLTKNERCSLLSLHESELTEWLSEFSGEAASRVARQLSAELTGGNPGCSLKDFLKASWHVLEPGHHFTDGIHVDAICSHAEACVDGRIKRLVINIPPGMSKSIIVSVALPCWVWTFKPWFRWLCASYDQETANDLSQKRRTLLCSEWYKDRWPDAADLRQSANSKPRDTIKLIQNTSLGEMLATSPKGRGLGKHPHGKVFDDLHNPKAEESLSEVSLRDVRNWINGPMATRGESRDINAFTINIMQRLAVGDASDVMLQAGAEHLCLPMEYDPDHPVRKPSEPTSIGFVDPRRNRGDLLCELRFGEEQVERIKRDLRYKAAGQLQQQPVALEGIRFKRSWFRIIEQDDVPSDLESRGKAVRYWDKAGTEGGGDWTAGVLIVHLDGKFYVADVRRGQWGSSNRKREIRSATEADSKRFRSYSVWQEQEPGSGGKESAENTEADLSEYNVRTEKVTGKKSERYGDWEEELDCVTNPRTPTVYLIRGKWNQDFIDEHCQWTWEDKSPTDDQIDAASGAYMKLKRRSTFVFVGASA